MKLSIIIFLSMTFGFFILSTIILYFLLLKQEDKLRMSNEEYKFGIFKTALIISLFLSGVIFLGAIITFIIKSILMQITLFLIASVGFVLLRKNLIINIKNSDKHKEQKILESDNIIEYRATVLNSIGYGFLGVFWIGFWLFIFNYNLFLSILGALVGCIFLVKMIINLSMFKVKLFANRLEYRTNFLKTVAINFETIAQIKINNKLLGSKSIELMICKNNNSSSQNKRIKINNLKNKIRFIKDLIRRAPQIEVSEKIESIIGN